MTFILAPLVWWVRLWQTRRATVSAAERLVRALLMLPAFAGIVLLLRIHLWFGGALAMDVKTGSGDRFRCHPPDLIQMYLWIFGVWEPDLTVFIRDRLKPGDTFIDVGANIGYYTVIASKCVGETGRVVAIEASPRVFDALRETIAINGLESRRVRAVNKAAAAQPGTLTIYSGPLHNIGLTTTVARAGMTATSQIEAQPLDDLLNADEIRTLRLIKIDVEGGEADVMAGMRRILNEAPRNLELLIELSPLWWKDQRLRPIDVLQPFLDAGFNVYEMDNNYWPWPYLWPNCIKRPWRSDRDFTQRLQRLDLLLSRTDARQI